MSATRSIFEAYLKSEPRTRTSARNVFCGRVTSVRSDRIMVEVIAKLHGNVEVCALITVGNVERIKLSVKDDAWVVFDTSAVILSVAWHSAVAQEVIREPSL